MADPSRPVTGYPAPPYARPYPQSAAAANNNGQPNGAYPYPYPVYQRGGPYDAYNARAAFIRRFVVAMVFLFAIIGSLLLMIWLILRPKIPDFRVDSLAVTNLNVSSSSRQSLTGTWSVGFDAYNPNKKMTIEYDEIVASVFYGSGFISETRLPPFKQGKRFRSTVNATFSAVNSFVDDRVASGINADRARGTVSFSVKVLARVQFRKGGWRLRRRLLRVLCRDVPVTISNNGSGKMTGGGRDCSVAV